MAQDVKVIQIESRTKVGLQEAVEGKGNYLEMKDQPFKSTSDNAKRLVINIIMWLWVYLKFKESLIKVSYYNNYYISYMYTQFCTLV